MKHFVLNVFLLTIVATHLPAAAVADTTCEFFTSIEVLVDSCDTIIIAEIAEELKTYAKTRKYRAVEVIKPHDGKLEKKEIEAKYTEGLPKDRVMIFMQKKGDELAPVHVISFKHSRWLEYYFNFFRENSKGIDCLAVDRWGVIIDHPDKLILKVKERMRHNEIHPPTYPPQQDFKYPTGAATYSPPDWEYDDGYDIIPTIIVPPDTRPKEKKEPEPKGMRLPIETAPKLGSRLKVAQLLQKEDVTKFSHAEFTDFTLGDKFTFSKDRKHVILHDDDRAYVYRTETGQPLVALTTNSYGYYGKNSFNFSTAGKYFYWNFEENFHLFDLAANKEILTLPRLQYQHPTFSPNDRFIIFRITRDKSVTTVTAFKIWDIEAKKIILQMEGSPGTFDARFSPKGNYICVREPKANKWYVVETATGKQLWELPNNSSFYNGHIYSPDETTFVRHIGYERHEIEIVDLRTGVIVKKINLSCHIDSVRYLDDTSLFVQIKPKDPNANKFHDALIISTRPDDNEYQRVKYTTSTR